MARSAIRDDLTARADPGFRSAGLRRHVLLPVIRQHLVAGFAEAGTVLLEASEHGAIAIVHHGTAEARHIARAGIVAGLLLR
ncbi:hypothetical protein ACVWXN_008560 [Bradyrhizobium sp. i1.4.4]